MLKSYVLDKMVEESTDSIYLAGPTYRVAKGGIVPKGWRHSALTMLEEKEFDGVVYIPEYPDDCQPEDWTYSRQVDWERKAMSISKVILFWIPRNEILPAFTTNIEFGEWLNSGKIAVGAPSDSPHLRYIKERCKRSEISWAETLSVCIDNALTKLRELTGPVMNVFITSDTHFGEERTLQLSKRPFSSVEEMDWEMVKQWNALVTDKDTVYHLGDFGNPKMLQHLKGERVYILPGNYDKEPTITKLEEDSRVIIIKNNFLLMLENIAFRLIHAPEEGEGIDFFLFGHIHKLQMVKENGLNVGVDCHSFKPIDAKTALFYRNAIVNHYDCNVFMSNCMNKRHDIQKVFL
jgi:calcineurin-like phosphoesterase family protein